MNNSVFRKTMENIRNHKGLKLVTSQERYTKYVMKPNFKDGYPFSKVLFAIEIEKAEIKMNKQVPLWLHVSKVKSCYMSSWMYWIATRFLQSHCQRRRDKV